MKRILCWFDGNNEDYWQFPYHSEYSDHLFAIWDTRTGKLRSKPESDDSVHWIIDLPATEILESYTQHITAVLKPIVSVRQLSKLHHITNAIRGGMPKLKPTSFEWSYVSVFDTLISNLQQCTLNAPSCIDVVPPTIYEIDLRHVNKGKSVKCLEALASSVSGYKCDERFFKTFKRYCKNIGADEFAKTVLYTGDTIKTTARIGTIILVAE